MERDSYFDNAKFFLIVLVVLGHFIEPINTVPKLEILYTMIYSFHMPAFILVSGYFSKHVSLKSLVNLFILYLVFSLVYLPFNVNKYSLLTPYYTLWYLVSLICWKLALPYFAKSKKLILLAILISVLAGYISQVGLFLSLSRTIVFFPFFLFGYFADRKFFDRVMRYKYILLLVMVGSLMLIYIKDIDAFWFKGYQAYSLLNHSEWYAGIYRIAVYGLQFVITISFLALVPKSKTIFSKLGQHTLQVYMLHGLIVRSLVYFSLYGYINSRSEYISLIICAILLPFLLSTRFFSIFFIPTNLITEFIMRKIRQWNIPYLNKA